MDLFLAAENFHKDATISQTQERYAGSFTHWQKFLHQISINEDEFLIGFKEPWCQTLHLSAFAQVMREDWFSSNDFGTLVESTFKTAVNNVALTIQANNRPDPQTDKKGRIDFIS